MGHLSNPVGDGAADHHRGTGDERPVPPARGVGNWRSLPDRTGLMAPAEGHAAPAARPDASARPAIGVLADRLAPPLVHHEPGWRPAPHTGPAPPPHPRPPPSPAGLGQLGRPVT